MKGFVSKIETSGFVDGPGIRTVVFMDGCKLRCKYCHNPEMWEPGKKVMSSDELVSKILRNKEYFGSTGGVTFSGGEPLIQDKFLIEVCEKLKKENINIALDTAGVGNGNYEPLLSLVDLVILDIKDVDPVGYQELTGHAMDDSLSFIDACNNLNKKMWIRQVIVPERNDNEEYLQALGQFLKHINNIDRIEFLPYHNMAIKKYQELGIDYPYQNVEAMDKKKCERLYNLFTDVYNKQEVSVNHLTTNIYRK